MGVQGFRAWRQVCAVAVAVVALLLLLAPGRAAAASPDTVVMYSEGDWVGAGVPRLYVGGRDAVSVRGTPAYLTVYVEGGPYGDYFDLDFAAPPGAELAEGVYTDAQRAPFRAWGRPGIDISGDGRGCNQIAGHFEVKDIGTDAGGRVDRLWIVYTQYCEGGGPALFGEVRIGQEGPPGAFAAAASHVRWPETDHGRAGLALPVTVLGRAPRSRSPARRSSETTRRPTSRCAPTTARGGPSSPGRRARSGCATSRPRRARAPRRCD